MLLCHTRRGNCGSCSWSGLQVLVLSAHLADRIECGDNACGRDSRANCVSQNSAGPRLGVRGRAWAQAAASLRRPSKQGPTWPRGILCIPLTMGKAPFLRTGEWSPMAIALLTAVTCGVHANRSSVQVKCHERANKASQRGHTHKAMQTGPTSQTCAASVCAGGAAQGERALRMARGRHACR